MRVRYFVTWAAAAVALSALIVADADACGRRRGCGSGGAAYGGSVCGCDGLVVYSFAAPIAPTWQGTIRAAPNVMPTTPQAGGAIAPNATRVFVLDPATGQPRQVGWLNADGTLRPLNATPQR